MEWGEVIVSKTTKSINLALQGGGSHGALAWGIIDKLLEDDRLKFDSVSSTSAGTMNAAVLAYGLATGGNDGAREELHNFWRMISEAGALYSPMKMTPMEEMLGVKMENSMAYNCMDLLSKILSPYQLNPLNFNPLRDVLEKCIDFDKIKTSKKLKLFISATNVKTGKIKVFENKDISIDTVLASACLPFMFQSVQVENDFYWDGGYMGNPAIFPLIYNSDCPDILIIHLNPIFRDQVPDSAAEILNRMNEISFNSSLMREMRAISFVSKMLDNRWIKDEYRKNMKRLFMHAIRADVNMQLFSVASKLNTDWDFLTQLHEEGRRQGEAWLKQHFGQVGKETTIDMDEYL